MPLRTLYAKVSFITVASSNINSLKGPWIILMHFQLSLCLYNKHCFSPGLLGCFYLWWKCEGVVCHPLGPQLSRAALPSSFDSWQLVSLSALLRIYILRIFILMRQTKATDISYESLRLYISWWQVFDYIGIFCIFLSKPFLAKHYKASWKNGKA